MTNHVFWKNNSLYLLDQRELPFKKTYLKCDNIKDVAYAIKSMAVRGAPLIGIVAAYGVVLGIFSILSSKDSVKDKDIENICER